MKLLIVAALMFPLLTLVSSAIALYFENDKSAENVLGIITGNAVAILFFYGILYLIFGE